MATSRVGSRKSETLYGEWFRRAVFLMAIRAGAQIRVGFTGREFHFVTPSGQVQGGILAGRWIYMRFLGRLIERPIHESDINPHSLKWNIQGGEMDYVLARFAERLEWSFRVSVEVPVVPETSDAARIALAPNAKRHTNGKWQAYLGDSMISAHFFAKKSQAAAFARAFDSAMTEDQAEVASLASAHGGLLVNNDPEPHSPNQAALSLVYDEPQFPRS